MKIGIMCATIRELTPVVEKMENPVVKHVWKREYHCGRLHGLDAVVVMGGVGKVNAAVTAQELINRFGVEKEMSRFIHIGFGNIVNTDKIIAVVSPESAPVRRLVQRLSSPLMI